MKKVLLILPILMMLGCVEQQPKYGNATVYTTPGSPGGVSYSKYEVTPL
jgi:hypothetical protein